MNPSERLSHEQRQAILVHVTELAIQYAWSTDDVLPKVRALIEAGLFMAQFTRQFAAAREAIRHSERSDVSVTGVPIQVS